MFGRGGPLSTATVSAKLALALIGVSIIAAVAPTVGMLLELTPARTITQLMLWQPLTYTFVAKNPLQVIFGALIVWSIGSALEMTWGSKRMVTFALVTSAIAGVLTALIALVWSSLWAFPFGGAVVLTSVLWVGYGWSFGKAQTNFWGMPLSGNGLAAIGIGFVALNAAFARSLVPVLPEVIAILLTFVYVKVGSPRVLFLKLRQWKLQRELKGRSKHLNVLSGGRREDRGSDRYIH